MWSKKECSARPLTEDKDSAELLSGQEQKLKSLCHWLTQALCCQEAKPMGRQEVVDVGGIASSRRHLEDKSSTPSRDSCCATECAAAVAEKLQRG